MAYIYRHIRLDKNEPFYIGISKKEDNYNRAKSTYRRNKIWWDIVNKNNGNYKVEIILDELPLNIILQKEMEFINLYGRIDIKTGILSNLTNGGEKNEGIVHTKETIENMKQAAKKRIEKEGAKEKISIATKNAMKNPDVLNKIREANKNRIYTQEWRDNIGKSIKGKKHSEETKTKMSNSAKNRGNEHLINNYISRYKNKNTLINKINGEIYPSIYIIAKVFGICRKKLKKEIDKGTSDYEYCNILITKEIVEKYIEYIKIKIN